MSIKKKRERRDFGETINRWELIAIEIYANSKNRDNKFMNRLFSRLLLGIYKKRPHTCAFINILLIVGEQRVDSFLIKYFRKTKKIFFRLLMMMRK